MASAASDVDYLGSGSDYFSMTHQQQWGEFGLNTAAAAPGRPGSPLQIGEKSYTRGLGHHADGEIVVHLRGQYRAFQTTLGVQWQGGKRGSVIFQVFVDGKTAFETGPMSDSDPAKEIEVSVESARELRLVASNAGDGIACDMANWAEARLVRDPHAPCFGPVQVAIDGRTAPPSSGVVCGLEMIASQSGPQIAVMRPAKMFVVSVCGRESVQLSIPLENVQPTIRIAAEVSVVFGAQANVSLGCGEDQISRQLRNSETIELSMEPTVTNGRTEIVLATQGVDSESGVRWRRLRYVLGERECEIPLYFPQVLEEFPPAALPNPRPAIEQQLIEWDWRMQDGIGTERESRTWDEAIGKLLQCGDWLIQDLERDSVPLGSLTAEWEALRAEHIALATVVEATEGQWADLWQRFHLLRRRIVFANPLTNVGPLLFAKRVPASFSHQLTQYYGMCARPGGGIFVLDNPGHSMACRELTSLPRGSYQHPEVSWDGRSILFSFCEADSAPVDRATHTDRVYHLFEMRADGSELRQLTFGPYDDFSPRYLPDGKILFLSTRRGGYHRCGRGPCPVYTMAIANRDGSNPHVISFHETHEWDPAILNDGRIIYTRWDYVDRHAVHYQQLWTARPDGSNAAAYYGNNTLNPVGVWEARPVPDSKLVMATAGAHHAMTAGSIILLDVDRGFDGLEPILRLTPDALFPESEFRVKQWHATAGISTEPVVPPEEKRWPGHCYRTPYPLSKDYFFAAYSFDPLIGEPFPNKTNMFGIYLVDRFGNKELVYRDASIGSLWPTPLSRRPRPPVLPSTCESSGENEGTFFLQNVNDSWPPLPDGEKDTIRSLRILQVLVKTTPHANTPKVGLANASPGKQVLGTVPVEEDGSAYFRAPARVPLAFQALDEHGMAVQTMRSLTYLQPGERAGCIGCHEHRGSTPDRHAPALARKRPPSQITPAPDGSRPLSYPILVQPVLDQHCVRCHRAPDADGGILLTGEPQGAFSASYNALAPLVPFSEWKSTPAANFEPLTHPNRFGARASRLTQLLLGGHEDVKLTDLEMERFITWMDANALFYGSFDPEDQQRQQRGDRIVGPAID